MVATYRFEDPVTGKPLPRGQGKPVIYLFGRDSNRTRQIKRIVDFRPHFWAASKESSQTDIFGRPIKEIIYDDPSRTRELREKFEYHCEADVLFWLRYLIDKKILCGYEVNDGDVRPAPDLGVPPKILYFDIEAESPPEIMPNSNNPKWPIVSLQFSNNYTDDLDIFLLDCKTDDGRWLSESVPKDVSFRVKHKSGETVLRPNLRFFKNEAQMLHEAALYVEKLDPDIPTGWNSSNFDFPYWIRRAQYLHVPISRLSPFGVVQYRPRNTKERRGNDVYIKGRDPVDMLDAYKKWTTGRQPIVTGRPFGVTYDLKIVVQYETGLTYTDYGDQVEIVRRRQPMEWIRYVTIDAFALKLLDRYTGLFEHFDRLRRIYGVPLSWSLKNSKLIDTWLLRIRDKPLPTKSHREHVRAKGAFVLQPRPGIHEHVAVLDLKTIYPMVIMAFNLSPETKDPEGKIVVKLDNGSELRFRHKPEGLLPKAVRVTYEERERLREKSKTLPYGSAEYLKTKQLETLYKYLTCSYFGVMGYENFRLFDPEVKECILTLGRRCLMLCKESVERQGYEVIYGDTDSLFIKLRSSHPGEGRILEKVINDTLRSFALRHHARLAPYAKYEEFFERVIFKPKTGASGAAKKRYAGITNDGHLIVVGLEPRRSGTAGITRQTMIEWLRLILVEDDVAKAMQLLRKTYNELPRLPVNQVAIPRGLHKTEYKVRNPWLIGCQFMQKFYGIRFREDRKPMLLYMNERLTKPEPTRVICITEDMERLPPELQRAVDWQKMREVVLRRTFEPLLKAIGYDWNYVLTGNKQVTLARWSN